MKKEEKKIWFPAKKYGLGWGLPIAWQGWVVVSAYILLVTGGAFFLSGSAANRIWLSSYIGVLTIFLIFICWKKGEKMEWRWGNKK